MPRTVLLVTSNGAGLGHLTRMMAVARRLPDGVRPVIFTLSRGASVAVDQGFFVEYMASAEQLTGGSAKLATRIRWNALLRDRLRELVELYDPAAVLFDGTHPYIGLVAAMLPSPRPRWLWCRRGMWRRGLGRSSLARAKYFHAVIEPGDLAETHDDGPTTRAREGVVRVPPVLYLDREELLGREEAEEALGLDPGRIHAFVQLGAGNINDISSIAGRCVKRLLADERVQVVFGDSAISSSEPTLEGGLVRVREYPVSRYARAFDLAVSAAGYNTFHELMAYGVPTLFVPNLRTKLDDQAARARYARDEGMGLTWDEGAAESLEDHLTTLLDDEFRLAARARLDGLRVGNGAADVAGRLASIAESAESGRGGER